MRAALSRKPFYAEVCWACGDNASVLAARLRLGEVGRARLRDEPSRRKALGAARPPRLRSSGEERHGLAARLREKVEGAVCAERATKRLCRGRA